MDKGTQNRAVERSSRWSRNRVVFELDVQAHLTEMRATVHVNSLAIVAAR